MGRGESSSRSSKAVVPPQLNGGVLQVTHSRRAVDVPVKPVWQVRFRSLIQFMFASVLLVAGVVYALQIAHPVLVQPGVLAQLPAAIIEAPSFAEEAERVALVLRKYTKHDDVADRIAGVLVDEGRRRNLDPALLVGVLITEDATLDTMARSNVGASGLMQVMPFHKGKWGCGSSNLYSIESNICHGASVLEDVVRNAPNMRVALLRYNGCVRGTNTRNCHTYPDKVMRVANRATADMLAMAN
jgi:soluble lytic murein transglycosylase-like protein